MAFEISFAQLSNVHEFFYGLSRKFSKNEQNKLLRFILCYCYYEFNFMSLFLTSNANFIQSHRQIESILAREKMTKNRPDSFEIW